MRVSFPTEIGLCAPGPQSRGQFLEYRRLYGLMNAEALGKNKRQYHALMRDVESYREYRRAYRLSHPEKLREGLLRYHHHIGLAEYNALLQSQGRACAICGTTYVESPKRLAVDHDHETGLIRGLLCAHCNQGLGHFRNNPSFLRKAADYVEAKK